MEIPRHGLAIDKAKNVDSTFIDFKRFEGDSDHRTKQREEFFGGKIWTPDYDYPNLDGLYDYKNDADTDKTKKTFLLDRKSAIQEAVYRLEAAKLSGEIDPNEAELYAAFHEVRLKKMMMVEAAKRLSAGNGAAQEVARREFMALNVEIFGEYDEDAYRGMLHTERQQVEVFKPKNKMARNIKTDLQRFFDGKELPEAEEQLLDDELIGAMQPLVRRRFGDVLAVIPNGGTNRVFDADKVRVFFQDAFEVMRYREKGWQAVVDPKKSNPSTAANKHRVSLPVKTMRTASQAEQLLAHELIHAIRGQNGEDSGLRILQRGTANYADVEEGLGVLIECILAGNTDNPAYHRARNRYLTVGLALGVEDAPRDSRQTFEIMWRLSALRSATDGIVQESVVHAAMDEAYAPVENIFRGTNFAMPGIIYFKPKVYREGLHKNVHFFRDNINDLDAAFDLSLIGKSDHTNPQERAAVQALIAKP